MTGKQIFHSAWCEVRGLIERGDYWYTCNAVRDVSPPYLIEEAMFAQMEKHKPVDAGHAWWDSDKEGKAARLAMIDALIEENT